ncbi:MAG: ATP-binding protein [Patescibacteria group bacterium]|nr:ATP-binding protein [Patescibacteria group bacterium]
MNNKLYRRKIVEQIDKFLDSKEIIVLHGARQVGKTSIMLYLIDKLKKQNQRNQIFYFDLEISRFLELVNSGFEQFYDYLLTKGYKKEEKAYVFIDEIQHLDDPSNFLKLFHDNYSDKIKLTVSGSSSFEIKNKFKDSLVGRTVNFEIWPLDFEEFLLFKNKQYNLSVKNFPEAVNQELNKLYRDYVLYGGYPQIVLEDDVEKKEIYLNQIIDTYIKKDIRDLAKIRNIDKFNKLIQVLAAQSGNMLNVLELANTVDLSRQTVEEYLFLLENTYIIKLVSPFHKNLRSELFKKPKVYLVDHGIANLLAFKTFPEVISGSIFETAIFSDLLKRRKKSLIYFWRTSTGQEIDFVVGKKDLILIEVKLNANSSKLGNLKFFIEKYKRGKGYLVFLDGKARETKHGVRFIYPWQLETILN